MKKTPGYRHTPWDSIEAAQRSSEVFGCSVHAELRDAAGCVVYYLQDGCVIVPKAVTQEDARQLMWLGLPSVSAEDRAGGMSDYRLGQMVQSMAGHIHDAATDTFRPVIRAQRIPAQDNLWLSSLHRAHPWVGHASECVYSQFVGFSDDYEHDNPVPASKPDKSKSVTEDLFVACEEDRPVPVTVKYKKMEPLLDPDADLLESAGS